MSRGLLAVALLAAALAAGCGNDGDDDGGASTTASVTTTLPTNSSTTTATADAYTQTVLGALSAMSAFASSLESVKQDNLKQTAPALRAQRADFEEAAAAVKAATPPAELASAHATLTAGLDSLDAAMLALADAAGAGDEEGFLAADSAFIAASRQVSDAAAQFEQAGS